MKLQNLSVTDNTHTDIRNPYQVTCSPSKVNTNGKSTTVATVTVCSLAETVVIYEGIVSEETRYIVELIIVVILTGVVCLFGIVSNIINIIVFYKQGLNTTVNISFFALAISDGLSLAIMKCLAITCCNPVFIDSVPYWDTRQVAYLSTAWPHFSLERITCWITTYITAERCLCIAMPLKVKQIVTPKRTTFIMCFLYVINLSPMIPFYLSSYLDWVFIPERNHTLLTMVARESISVMEPVAFVMYAILGTASFPVVVLFTVILVHRLRRQRTWRMKSSSDQTHNTATSKREVQTMHLVVVIAGILIACYTPGILMSMATSFVPSFNLSGTEVNLFLSVWSFGALLHAVNSSINIFLYFKMSSKYKRTFMELFFCYKGMKLDVVKMVAPLYSPRGDDIV